MRFNPDICPECKESAIGTLERLTGVARFSEPDEDGRVNYTGTTDIYWEGQMTDYNSAGLPILLCAHGHEWPAEDLDGEIGSEGPY